MKIRYIPCCVILHSIVAALILLPLQSTGQCITKQEWQNPKPEGNNLFSVFFVTEQSGYIIGERGAIVKTTDGGDNWTRLESGTHYALRGSFFTSEDTGYVCGDSGLVMKTTDAGASWTKLITGHILQMNDIAFTSSDTGYACGRTGKIIKTTDGGQTWTALTSGTTRELHRMHFPTADVGYISANNGVLLKTVNAGSSWSIVAGVTAGSHTLKSLFFFTPDTGWVIGSSGLIRKTVDGGANWTSSGSAVFDLKDITFFNSQAGMICGHNTLMQTTDGGATWVARASNTTQSIEGIGRISGTEACLAGDFGTIVKTSDTGTTWVVRTPGSRENLKGVSFPTALTGYVVGNNGELLKTTNGGASWSILPPVITGTYLNDVYFIDNNNGFVTSIQGYIWRTVDGGANWTVTNTGTSNSLNAVHFFDKDNGFVCGSNPGIIHKTFDGGDNWYQYHGPSSADYLYDIHFGHLDTGYAVGWSGFATGLIYRSVNNGTDWFQLTAPSSTTYRGVHFFNGSTGFIVGDDGNILRTTNAGASWTTVFSSGGKLVAIDFFDRENGIAIGEPIGDGTEIFATRDGGVTWSRTKGHAPFILGNVVMTDRNTGFAVGWGGAIIKLTNGIPDVITTDASRCGPGTVQLSASNASKFHWFTSLGSMIVADSGATITTPFLGVTDTFYVAGIEGSCESRRNTVIAKVNQVPVIDSIMGLKTVNESQTTTYSVNHLPASVFQWIITGGTGSNTQSFVDVTWGSAGTGKVSVIETTIHGCKSNTAELSVIIKAPNGIEDAGRFPAFRISPNPNNGSFFISGNDEMEGSMVEIYDCMGRMVLKQNINSSVNSFDLENSGSGIYLVYILTSGGKNYMSRVVVE
jgi:photosystem II stability/assembly factor-like uncharacterized protein